MSKANSEARRKFYVGIVSLVLCMLFVIGLTSQRIYLHSQPPTVTTGTLEDVSLLRRNNLKLYVDGQRYLVSKNIYSADRTFGIIMNSTQRELASMLEGKIGSECRIEYIQLGSIDSHWRQVIDLRINDFVFVDKEIANRDIIAEEKEMRNIGFAGLAICAVLVILERMGIIK